jgi:hypothetical protein
LGLDLNNRLAYLQYYHGYTYHRLPFDASSKSLLLSVLAFATFTLIAIAGLFIALFKCRRWKVKEGIKTPLETIIVAGPSLSLVSRPTNCEKNSLQVRNCYDYNDTSLLMFNKDLTSPNDHSSLLDTRIDKDQQDEQRQQVDHLFESIDDVGCSPRSLPHG